MLQPVSLAAARAELHGAAVLLGSVADALLPDCDDDSQSNLGLTDAPRGFATHDLGGAVLALDGAAQTLVWSAGGAPERFALPGHTMEQGLAWVTERARQSLGRDLAIPMREYDDMPTIGALDGGRFERAGDAALAAFFDWYSNAFALFEGCRAEAPALSEVRIWPHHFDLGALLPVSPPEAVIGIGLSPGDDTSPEPYLYCSPYPQPADAETPLPRLEAGAWLRGAPTTAWLRAEVLTAAQDQHALAERYLRGAIAACRAIVG